MQRLGAMMTFAKVVEAGSFSAAARALGASKSHVSKQVAALERSIGVRLLNRTTRRLSLTEAGVEFHAHCERIAQEADAAVEAVSRLQAAPRGTLRLSAPVTFAAFHLAPALADFLARHPEVEIELDASDRAVDLAAEGFDLALRLSSAPAPGLVARRIAPLRWITCAAPAYLQAHGTPREPQDLASHRCIGYGGLPTVGGWRFRVGGRVLTLQPRGPCRANSATVVHRMAVAGLGIVHFPDYVVGADLAAGRLVPLLQEFEAPDRSALYAVWLPNRHVQPKVRAFIDFALERFGERAIAR